MKFIAYCTKGLEEIAQLEIITVLPGSKILKQSTKRIIFESDLEYQTLITLKTVDDLAIYIDKIDLSKLKSLGAVVEKLSEINLPEIYSILKKYRDIKFNQFSLTVALINYKKFAVQNSRGMVQHSGVERDDLKNALAQKLSEKYSSEYSPKDHSNCDVRINIENNIALIGVKLTPESLFNREYKVAQMLGSLKPTIAAAMVKLAIGNKKDLKVVDNYCGSGTILCEALLKGNEVYGGDINELAVKSTIENLKNLRYDPTEKFSVQDGSRTNWPDRFFDCAITNLPWGKQVKIESITELYKGCIEEYARIVKDDGTICFILTNPDLMKSLVLRNLPGAKIKEYLIGFLGQRPTIMVISI